MKKLIEELKQENHERSVKLNISISQPLTLKVLSEYNLTIEFIKRLEKIIYEQ